jgi:hypothetical protein
MASPIIPKSDIRQIRSISHGYGEIPIVDSAGKRGWALPGNVITFCEAQAKEAAAKMDSIIRANLGTSRRRSL